MKIKLFFFCTMLFIVLFCCNNEFYADEPFDCNSFLTCVNVPQSCGQSFKRECENGTSFGKTFFSIRPQDSNSANRLVRLVNEDHTKKNNYRFAWGFDCTLGAQQSFGNKDNNVLAKWFLFNGSNRVTVGMPNNSTFFDVDGNQFGLLTANSQAGRIGTLSLNPTLKNIISNINFWFDLNTFVHRMWARTYFTAVNTKTSLGLCSQTNNVQTSGDYPDGQFTTNCGGAPIAYTTVIQAFKGNIAFGDVPALLYGKFYGDSKSTAGLASIRFDLGFDVIKKIDSFLNCAVCVLVPTANRPKGTYLFEPVVGANKSWQLGVEFTGAYNGLYASQKMDVDLYVDATFTHLFKTKQTRVFSLKNNGAGSQYLLVKQFDLSIGVVEAGERVANIFAGQAHIGSNIMVDASVMMHLTRCSGFFFDLGYNFWLRSKETLSKTVCLRNFEKDKYGVKGDLILSEIDDFSGFCIGNLSTASQSTIGHPATADAATITLDVCDINFNAPLHPTAFSNKIFTAFGYSRDLRRCNSKMNFSVEGEVELGHKALNQWALNVNIGFSR